MYTGGPRKGAGAWHRKPTTSARVAIGVLAAAVFLAGCAGGPAAPQIDLDPQPFRQLAREADCAQQVNRLFVIDGDKVFWDRRGNCPDNAYRQVLFGATVDEILCEQYDSIAGPRQDCSAEEYRDLFEAVLGSSEAPDLGLGLDHAVVEIEF